MPGTTGDDGAGGERGVLGGAVEDSAVVELYRRCRRALVERRGRVRSGRASSRAVHQGRRLTSTASSAADGSRMMASVRAGRRVVVRSYLYRWFTSDPDPDVVVIDLEDTMTGRMLFSLLGVVVAPLERGYASSRVRGVAESVRSGFRDAPVRALAALIGAALLAETALGRSASRDLALVPRLVLALAVILGLRSTSTWQDLRDGRPGRLVRAILTPPTAPSNGPETQTEETTATEENDDQ